MNLTLREHRRWAACLVLLAYACAATRLLPMLAAALAAAAGDHRVFFEMGREDTSVVLAHDPDAGNGAQCCPPATHRHGVLSQVVVAFAEPPQGDGHADHVLHFKSGSSTDRLHSAVAPAPSGEALAAPMLIELGDVCTAGVPPAALAAHGVAPSGGSGVNISLRTTVLLI